MIDSEIIVKYVIEKLVSISITNINSMKLDEKIPDFCFDYMKKLLTDTLSQKIMTYDKDRNHQNVDTFTIKNNEEIIIKKEIFLTNNLKGFNDFSPLEEPKLVDIDRAASTSIKTEKKKEIPIPNNETIPNSEKKVQNLPKSVKKPHTKDSKDSTIEKKKKQDKKGEPVILPLSDVEEYSDPDDIKDERRRKANVWRKIEEEKNIKIKSEKERIDQDFEYIKKQKDLEKKNVTSDINGNLVLVKGVAPDKLVQDFIMTRITLDDKGVQTIQIETTNTKKKEEPVQPVSNAQKERLQKANTRTNKVEVKEKEITKLKKDEPKKYIQPVGSNFEVFVPEVGVTILEGSQMKTGGTEYGTVFHKPSIHDYKQLIKDTIKTHYGTFKNQEFSKNEQIEKMSKTTNQLLLPSLAKKTYNNDRTDIFGNDSIKVSDKLVSSLKNALDELDTLKDYDKKLEDHAFRNTNSDLFKTKKTVLEKIKEVEKENINASLEEINKFNLGIMKNTIWGQNSSKQKPNTANKKEIKLKPSEKDFEKEMGKTIVSHKMPRSRKSSKNKYLSNKM